MKTKLFNLSFFLCVFFAMFSSCSNEENVIDSDENSVEFIDQSKQFDNEDRSTYNIILVGLQNPDYKTRVMLEIKKLFMYDLKTAKYLVEQAPSFLGKTTTEASSWYVSRLVDAGAKVRLE